MQALIVTCLLCLQTSNPCDSNPLQAFSETPDCSKCLADLRGSFNLPDDKSIEPIYMLANSAESDISPELKENLDSLLVDSESILDRMSQNPDELKDLVNKMKFEIDQDLTPGGQPGQATNAETLKKVQKQEHLLGRINEKVGELSHQNEALKEKLKMMRGVLSNEENDGEIKKRRDTLKYGEKLMIGEALVSKNGKWKFMMDKETGESLLYDNKGNIIKKSLSCDFPKPISSNIHIYMNQTVEYYADIWNGKSANLRCLAGTPMPCVDENVQCYLGLDNDGHLKFFLPSGEPCYTYF